MSRRDSIPEEIEEDRLAQITGFPKSKVVPRKTSTTTENLPQSTHESERKQRNSWHSDDNNPT